MAKKKKFDLTQLVHDEHLKDGDPVYYVSDPAQVAIVTKQPSGEYKLTYKNQTFTVFALAQQLLGQEPPDHASKWFRSGCGRTLYELWQTEDYAEAA